MPRMIHHLNLDTSEGFLRSGREHFQPLLDASRSLLDDSKARPLVKQLAAELDKAERTFGASLELRERFTDDERTRPEVMRQELAEARAGYQKDAQATSKRIRDLTEQIQTALAAEALPSSASPQEVALVRDEIRLALEAGGKQGALSILRGYAGRGGEHAAAAVSDWGRLMLRSKTGLDEGHEAVVSTAVRAAADSPDEGSRRAAQALTAATEGSAAGKGAVYYGAALNDGSKILAIPTHDRGQPVKAREVMNA